LANSQLPLASVYQATSSPAVFETADISDFRKASQNKIIEKRSFGKDRFLEVTGLTTTGDTIFKSIESFIPFTNDRIIVNGKFTYGISGGQLSRFWCHSVKRISIDEIEVYGSTEFGDAGAGSDPRIARVYSRGEGTISNTVLFINMYW